MDDSATTPDHHLAIEGIHHQFGNPFLMTAAGSGQRRIIKFLAQMSMAEALVVESNPMPGNPEVAAGFDGRETLQEAQSGRMTLKPFVAVRFVFEQFE